MGCTRDRSRLARPRKGSTAPLRPHGSNQSSPCGGRNQGYGKGKGWAGVRSRSGLEIRENRSLG